MRVGLRCKFTALVSAGNRRGRFITEAMRTAMFLSGC